MESTLAMDEALQKLVAANAKQLRIERAKDAVLSFAVVFTLVLLGIE
jgi:hypothetical protein